MKDLVSSRTEPQPPYYFLDLLLKDLPQDHRNFLIHSKYDVDRKLYFFGAHHARPFEAPGAKLLYRILRAHAAIVLRAVLPGMPRVKPGTIFSNAYFNLNQQLEALGYNVGAPPWARLNSLTEGGLKLAWEMLRFNLASEYRGLNIYRKQFYFDMTRRMKELLKDYFIRLKASALFLSSDIPFYESVSCEIFRDIKRPSFIFLHGLPGFYNVEAYHRKADYLVVWGKKIRDLYTRAGAPAKRILISGHPRYSGRELSPTPRNCLDSVLVISKSLSGASSTYFPILSDRGCVLSYVTIVQEALLKMGVRRARLRLHPSENLAWYQRNLPGDFYEFDRAPLADSLKESTLVIGPTSTMFIDSIYAGVNYLIFEPATRDFDLFNFPIAPPFNGKDNQINVAQDPSGLARLLRKRPVVSSSAIAAYIDPEFNLKPVMDIIQANT